MSSRSRGRRTPAYVESSDEERAWVETFCLRRGNEYFCAVPEDFLVDKFNLTGLGLEDEKLADAYDLIIDEFSRPGCLAICS